MKRIAILGSGTWGTALANMLAGINHQVILWSRDESFSQQLKNSRVHPNLNDVVLSDKIEYTSDIKHAVEGQDIIVLAVPSIAIREVSEKIKPFANNKQIIVTVAKGIESGTLMTMSEIINDVLGNDYHVIALSGPTHAEEVVKCLPTLIVAAGTDYDSRKIIQEEFSNDALRVYTNHDIKGVELCGALKNIIALAAGISEGLGYGDNAKAAIITRGLAEITRLGLALGAEEGTFAGLSGIGDIVVTAISNHSRNHNAGVLFGQGYKLDYVLEKIGMVVEGINALDAAKQLEEKYQVELPIIDMVYLVVKKEMDVQLVVPALFGRKKKNELKKYN